MFQIMKLLIMKYFPFTPLLGPGSPRTLFSSTPHFVFSSESENEFRTYTKERAEL